MVAPARFDALVIDDTLRRRRWIGLTRRIADRLVARPGGRRTARLVS